MVAAVQPVKISVDKLSVSFGPAAVLRSITMPIHARSVLSVIGPANSGKTTLLRTLNRLIDMSPSASVQGRVLLDGVDIFTGLDPVALRRKVGVIFAMPAPLPMTVFENVVYGPRRLGLKQKSQLDAIVEKSLRQAYLWDEMKDRLHESALKLSGGQQQRLCIARTLALGPEVLLFDEPCSALDPISTAKVEEAMSHLKSEYTIVLVTNNTKQAARVGDRTAFFLMGELIEEDETGRMFTAPRDRRTDDYISGRFG